MTDSQLVQEPFLLKRLAFETILAELSSRFVTVASDRLDAEIEDAQRRICDSLDLDLSSLWQWPSGDPVNATLTHYYRALDGPPIPEAMDAATYFPWVQQELLEGRVVPVSSMADLPPEASRDREVWEQLGIKTSLGIPLSVGGGRPFGVLSFNTMRDERAWPDDLVQRLKLVAEIFANALARRRSDTALQQSEQRLQLAAEAAGVGMWMLDAESGRFWANDRGRELFGFEKDTEITIARVLQSVCPEHRESLEIAVRRAVEDGLKVNIEYRIVLPDGSGRWINSTGRRMLATAPDAPHILGASVDISERKHFESRQAERLRFETLLADLSTTFVNLAADEVDAAIENAQRLVCEHLDIELSALWQWSRDNLESQTLTHLHRSGEGPPIPNRMDARHYVPWSLEQVVAGRTVILSSIDDAPPEAAQSKETWKGLGVKSTLIIPLAVGGEPAVGSLSFNSLSSERMWPDELVQRLRLVAEIFANALKRKHSEERLRDSFAEIERLKDKLELENIYLKQEHELQLGSGRIVGESPELMAVLELVAQVAPAEATVLILGETGTGKELVAQRIHELSPRRDRPMVKVNCAALPSTLVESELFGHEKGAYTGAVSREAGRFEIADGSTIFLDEIAELPLELQAKLLRVLEEGRFERVGSSRTLSTDVRVVAATNRDLKAEVEAKRFRSDLFFRLAVFPITVPPLRERRGDIPLLVWSMVQELSAGINRTVESIRREDMERLQRYEWPGNVRELRNVVERALILCSGPTLRIGSPTGALPAEVADHEVLSLDEMQRRHIHRALEAAGGRIRGPGGAAELLGMKATTLRSRMDRLGLDPRQLRNDPKAT